ncbi:UNKNOWN [Stylonychia lemnae]|uniref:Uncharacterized protein n=1 Tax=Stylonychia lemnae TaxID=5949 RepID=A0A078A403_STYLE|nr:UNKNOWN [Stylonychia lemnae]|eukprot:CDW76253.1 UNKNOWN [Stylonychia lemnae]
MNSIRGSSRVSILKRYTNFPVDENEDSDSEEVKTRRILMNKTSQKQFKRLLNDGVAEAVALKITTNQANQTEVMARLDKIIEGLQKFRHDFQAQREPRYQHKKTEVIIPQLELSSKKKKKTKTKVWSNSEYDSIMSPSQKGTARGIGQRSKHTSSIKADSINESPGNRKDFENPKIKVKPVRRLSKMIDFSSESKQQILDSLIQQRDQFLQKQKSIVSNGKTSTLISKNRLSSLDQKSTIMDQQQKLSLRLMVQETLQPIEERIQMEKTAFDFSNLQSTLQNVSNTPNRSHQRTKSQLPFGIQQEDYDDNMNKTKLKNLQSIKNKFQKYDAPFDQLNLNTPQFPTISLRSSIEQGHLTVMTDHKPIKIIDSYQSSRDRHNKSVKTNSMIVKSIEEKADRVVNNIKYTQKKAQLDADQTFQENKQKLKNIIEGRNKFINGSPMQQQQIEVSPSNGIIKEFRHLIYLRNKRSSLYNSRENLKRKQEQQDKTIIKKKFKKSKNLNEESFEDQGSLKEELTLMELELREMSKKFAGKGSQPSSTSNTVNTLKLNNDPSSIVNYGESTTNKNTLNINCTSPNITGYSGSKSANLEQVPERKQ